MDTEAEGRCFVYLILLDQGGGAGDDLLKVGLAERPIERLAQLQTGNPFDLHLIRLIEYPTRLNAERAEAYLHHELSKHRRVQRVRGEWFSGSLIAVLKTFKKATKTHRAQGYTRLGIPRKIS